MPKVNTPAGAPERITVQARTTADIRSRLTEAAGRSGRSLSQELELRLERSFERDDLRALIREELRAALAERNESLMDAALAMVRETPVPPKIYRY